MVTAAAPLADAGQYLQWGWFSISLTNLLIIVAMVVVFVLALLLPFPSGGPAEPAPALSRDPAAGNGQPDRDGSQP
jgi:cell division protein FtsN